MAKVARLLEKIVPEKYQVSLDVDMERFVYRGLESIDFELKQAAKELVFHAVGLEVELAGLETGARANAVKSEGQTVAFTFTDEIAAGKHTLNVAYRGKIEETLHGFYRSKYEHDGQEKWIGTTQFEAVHAREAFLCVDEPAAKAVLELSLVIPDRLTAISNTEVVSERPKGEGRKKVTFAPTPKMSTYLAAWVIGEFEHVERTTPEGVLVRVFATPGKTGQLEFALDTAVRTLSLYGNYFGAPYPLSKLDMIAIPDFGAGAMENWGAVTYRETALLLDPARTSLSSKQRVAEVVAHELAHQWFGNLVTMAWWDDLWLNEGFATWVASFAMNELFPEWLVWTQFVAEEQSAALDMNGLASAPALQVDIEDPLELDAVFDPAVVYAKGASVIRMLDAYLGRETFQKGLQIYLSRHSFANAVTHDLWEALGEASGKPVDEVMSDWTAKPGYPLLSFDEGEVSQRRFLSSPKEAARVKDETVWPVPFGAKLAGGKETAQELVTQKSAPLPDEIVGSDWFKPNPNQTALYRSLYTEHMIKALEKPLKAKELEATDRFGVVSDVFATTEAGATDSIVALKLVQTLREETDYVVWGALGGGFGSVLSVVEDEKLREGLERFGGWLAEPQVARLGWEPRDGESTFDALMRPAILQQAVRFENESVRHEAKKRFEHYLEGQPINPDLLTTVLYAAARYGGSDEYEAILERYRKEEIPQVKIGLLASLGRFRKPELIKRFLEWGLSEDVRSQDLYIVVAYGFHNRDGREQTWEWLKANWDEFVKRYGAGGHMLERFPLYAGSGFATHSMAKEIGEFFASHPHPATKRPTAQAVEGIELKADWCERDKTSIERFVKGWAR